MTKRIRRIIRTAALVTPFLLFANGAFAGAPTGDDMAMDDFIGDDFVQVVPEPTAALVMALGVAAVAYAHRRRR
jgi:hypothetical protein